MKHASVEEIMTREVRTVGRNDTLRRADELLREIEGRHLPVLDDDGDVCGVLSQRDLYRGALLRALGFGSRAEERLLETMVVKEAMREGAVTIAPSAPVAEAARRMVEHKIGCLPVVDGERLVGIVTETDLLRCVADGPS
jgi:CBS domain-containing protein